MAAWAADRRERQRTAKNGQKAAGLGAWQVYFLVLASENGFSKYSGRVVSTGRNRPRFAIRAHCGLLVTSVSPNCCSLNGILRKSHFPAQSSCENIPAKPPARRPSARSLPLSSRSLLSAAQAAKIDSRSSGRGLVWIHKI